MVNKLTSHLPIVLRYDLLSCKQFVSKEKIHKFDLLKCGYFPLSFSKGDHLMDSKYDHDLEPFNYSQFHNNY